MPDSVIPTAVPSAGAIVDEVLAAAEATGSVILTVSVSYRLRQVDAHLVDPVDLHAASPKSKAADLLAHLGAVGITSRESSASGRAYSITEATLARWGVSVTLYAASEPRCASCGGDPTGGITVGRVALCPSCADSVRVVADKSDPVPEPAPHDPHADDMVKLAVLAGWSKAPDSADPYVVRICYQAAIDRGAGIHHHEPEVAAVMRRVNARYGIES